MVYVDTYDVDKPHRRSSFGSLRLYGRTQGNQSRVPGLRVLRRLTMPPFPPTSPAAVFWCTRMRLRLGCVSYRADASSIASKRGDRAYRRRFGLTVARLVRVEVKLAIRTIEVAPCRIRRRRTLRAKVRVHRSRRVLALLLRPDVRSSPALGRVQVAELVAVGDLWRFYHMPPRRGGRQWRS